MIRRLYVNNYRCLENFDLKISENPSSLLLGKNGAGKSTVSFALEVLQTIARGTNRVSELVKPSDLSRDRADVPMRFVIEAQIDNVGYEYELALELPKGFKELRVFDEKLTVDNSVVFSRDTSQVQLIKSNREASFLVDWHLVALPIIQETSDTDPLYIFKTWLARMLILAPIPSLITGESNSETLAPNRQITNFGDWFTGLLANSPSAYETIANYIRPIISDFKDIKNPIIGLDARSIMVQFTQQRSQQEQVSLSLPFRALSDGEKCFFVCAIVLAANEAYGPIFCFWDEPDNHLSLDEVGHFIMALRRSFQKKGQLIITSHNEEAIRRFAEDNTFVLDRKSHFEPTIYRLLSELNVEGDVVEAIRRGDVEL